MEEDCLHYGGYFHENRPDHGYGGSHPEKHYTCSTLHGTYYHLRPQYNYLWDELAAAAWLDPTVITNKETRYMDVDLDHDAGYGNTLTWSESEKPKAEVQPVEVQVDLDRERFYKMFVELLSAATPPSR